MLSFISTRVLFAVWTINHYILKYCFLLTDIVPVCSGYDYRGAPIPVHHYMALCAVFFPCPLDFVQQFPLQAELSSWRPLCFATSMLFLPYHHILAAPSARVHEKSLYAAIEQNGCKWHWDCQKVLLARLATDNLFAGQT